MKVLFHANDFIVRVIEEGDLQKTLEVYQQAEDFLSLGPVPRASIEMVHADIKHYKESGGLYCMIQHKNGNHVGVVDFVPETTKGIAFLSLLLISHRFRNRGIGHSIVKNLESYLQQKYRTHTIESGVQTNNDPAINFWKKCGFKIGTNARAIGDGTIAYEMKKTLVPILP